MDSDQVDHVNTRFLFLMHKAHFFNRLQVSLLLLIDFSKAFDMVEHSILLKKLYHYGISGAALK